MSNIIFMYESGSPAYGIPNPGDVDLIIVEAPSIHNALDIWRKRSSPKEKTHKNSLLETKIIPFDHYLKQLWKPNINYAEWLFSEEHIVERTGVVDVLRQWAMDREHGIFALSAMGHFQGMIKSTLERHDDDWTKPKKVLYAMKTYLQGIDFFRNRRVEVNIPKLIDFALTDFARDAAKEMYDLVCAHKITNCTLGPKVIPDCKTHLKYLESELLFAHKYARDTHLWPEKTSTEYRDRINDLYRCVVR